MPSISTAGISHAPNDHDAGTVANDTITSYEFLYSPPGDTEISLYDGYDNVTINGEDVSNYNSNETTVTLVTVLARFTLAES